MSFPYLQTDLIRSHHAVDVDLDGFGCILYLEDEGELVIDQAGLSVYSIRIEIVGPGVVLGLGEDMF
jgi:hypothetical protein